MKNLFSYPKKIEEKKNEIHYLTEGIAMKRSTEITKEKFEAIGKEERKASRCDFFLIFCVVCNFV